LSIRVRTNTFAIGFDSDVANVVSYNMVDSLDNIARIAMDGGGTQVLHPNATAETDIVAADTLTGNIIRRQHAALRGASVMPLALDANQYGCLIHPDVAYDLKVETGDAGWVVPSRYTEPSRIWNNELGTFGGVRFIETARAKVNADAGSGAVDSYTTYFIGREAFAKAESIPPHIVPGPITDKLKRFMPLGWTFYLGYGVLRTAAVRRLLSASSIGSN
jgi:N4-gp56 family major capsid protein